MNRQYWADFFDTIFGFFEWIFLSAIIVSIIIVVAIFIPSWVMLIAVGIFILLYAAHDIAVCKAQKREEIDDEIANYQRMIRAHENRIVDMYAYITKASPDEDTYAYVHMIETCELEIEKFEKHIERLKIQRSMV